MYRITVISSLYNCQQYLEGYFEAVQKITNKYEIEILLIHNEPREKELDIINKYLPQLPCVKHIVVPEREGLYVSWNRGIYAAKGKYITNWNVDDVRLPDSLNQLADALDKNRKAAIAFGEFTMVSEYGKQEGKRIAGLQFEGNRKEFLRDFHISCFPMWRRELHDAIGYFDEQFRLVADFDFQIRAVQKFPCVKVDKHVGYYLEGTSSNLSSNLTLQDTELTALHLRYANFDLLSLPNLWNALKKFKIFRYKWNGGYQPIAQWNIRTFFRYVLRSPLLLISLIKSPRHFARRYLKPYVYKFYPKSRLSTSTV